MSTVQNLNLIKERIISFIQERGPSLPVTIAGAIATSPMFASAFLSELYAEGKVKLSNMRVGSSPLYMLPGQEPMLEKFIQYLNNREKEAHALLKRDKLLEDQSQEPVVRVALRAIKDFAIPIKIRIGEESRLFWKYFILPDSEIKKTLLGLHGMDESPVAAKEIIQETPKPRTPETKEIVLDEHPVVIKETKKIEQILETSEEKAPEQKKVKKEKTKKEESVFAKHVKSYLLSKNIELLSISSEKKKEFQAKIRIETLFGKQEYFLIARDKKKFAHEDLSNAYQKAQQEKMPVLLAGPGEIDKKALEYMKELRNLVKFEKIRA
ncbi:MAG: FaeA/PapI family transcriptional regulator [archaeon]